MNAMTLQRFKALADAYGGRVEAWPHETRGAAKALLENDATAADILKDALLLDEALESWTAPQPSKALMARILTDAAEATPPPAPIPQATPERQGFWDRFLNGPLWRPAGALAACLALGLALGATMEQTVLTTAFSGGAETAALEEAWIDYAFALDGEALLDEDTL